MRPTLSCFLLALIEAIILNRLLRLLLECFFHCAIQDTFTCQRICPCFEYCCYIYLASFATYLEDLERIQEEFAISSVLTCHLSFSHLSTDLNWLPCAVSINILMVIFWCAFLLRKHDHEFKLSTRLAVRSHWNC